MSRKILDEAIASEDIPAFDAYTKETKKKRNKRKRWYEKERRDFEKMKEESGDAAPSKYKYFLHVFFSPINRPFV